MKQKLIDNKLLNDFGWKHNISLKDGLTKTVEFFKNYIINEKL